MMTHIYKVYKAAAGALLLTAALAACTDDSREPMQENETPREGMFFSVTATQGEGADTRVEYQLNGNRGMDVTWAREDKIYVGKLTDGYLNTGNLSKLTKLGDAGGTTAQFEGNINSNHLPASGEKLYAVYGKAEKIQVSSSGFTYYYDGQRQTANGNMENAAEYDFMEASTEYNATSGFQHRFSFSHVGSMMKFTLHGLGGQTVKKLTLSTYEGSWVFGRNQVSVSLDLGTGSGFLVEDGPLEAYLMMAPNTKTAGKNFVLYVTTTEGKNFATLLTGAEIAAGKLYTVDATLAEYTFTGTGTSANPYKINDAGDLTKLAVMTNSGMMDTEGQYFQLTDDINMATGAEAWLPIGISDKPFKGTFSGAKAAGGGNYSILNLPGKTVDFNVGLFGSLYHATIKNVTVSGEIAMNGGNLSIYAGGIAGYAVSSTIESCISNCKIDISSSISVYVGGILGCSLFDINVTDCTNTGKVSSNKYSGGIIGYASDNGEMTNCTNRGEITSTSTEFPAGGIIGHWYMLSNISATLSGCTHNGSSPASNKAGSIIGSYKINSSASNSSITITNSGGNGSITGIEGQDTTGKWPASDL